MANNFTDYLESAIVNHFFRATSTTAPAAVYAGLFTAAPSEAGGGTEVSTSGTAYARQAVSFASPSPAGVIASSAAVNFPVPTASWGTITHVGIFDAVSGGNLLAFEALSSSIAIGTGQQPTFASGAITVTQT